MPVVIVTLAPAASSTNVVVAAESTIADVDTVAIMPVRLFAGVVNPVVVIFSPTRNLFVSNPAAESAMVLVEAVTLIVVAVFPWISLGFL